MARSNPVTVTVQQAPTKIPTSLSISVSPTSGYAPLNVSISGRLVDSAGTGLAYKTVNLIVNGNILQSTTTQPAGGGGIPAGYYSFSVQFDAGTYVIETEFPGDAEYEGCLKSNGVHVTMPTPNLLVAGVVLAGVAGLLLLAPKR
jgi:hypothetical protein